MADRPQLVFDLGVTRDLDRRADQRERVNARKRRRGLLSPAASHDRQLIEQGVRLRISTGSQVKEHIVQ